MRLSIRLLAITATVLSASPTVSARDFNVPGQPRVDGTPAPVNTMKEATEGMNWVNCYGFGKQSKGTPTEMHSVVSEFIPDWASKERVEEDFKSFAEQEGYDFKRVRCSLFKTIKGAWDRHFRYMDDVEAGTTREKIVFKGELASQSDDDAFNEWFYTFHGTTMLEDNFPDRE